MTPPGDRPLPGFRSGAHFGAFGGPRVDFRCFLVAPEPHRKIMFFRLSQKSLKMDNKWTLGGPMLHFLRFSMTFGNHSGIDFSIFSRLAKSMKSMTVLHFERIWHPKTGHFSIPFLSIFRPSLRDASWMAFLAPKAPIYTENDDFWWPFGFRGVPKWTSNFNFLAKKAPKEHATELR